MRIQNLPKKKIADKKFVIVGAGSAGLGVVIKLNLIVKKYGFVHENAIDQFYLLDVNGLISKKRNNLDHRILPFARKETEFEGMDLLNVIKLVKPNCLIGLSGAGRIFTKEILEEMDI